MSTNCITTAKRGIRRIRGPKDWPKKGRRSWKGGQRALRGSPPPSGVYRTRTYNNSLQNYSYTSLTNTPKRGGTAAPTAPSFFIFVFLARRGRQRRLRGGGNPSNSLLRICISARVFRVQSLRISKGRRGRGTGVLRTLPPAALLDFLPIYLWACGKKALLVFSAYSEKRGGALWAPPRPIWPCLNNQRFVFYMKKEIIFGILFQNQVILKYILL